MQAIILAAGMGKRLKEHTKNNTKCMVRVNGVHLIDRMLHQLEQHNLSRIVIVIGYCGDKLREHIESLNIKVPVVFVENNIYDKTNNIYSLWLAHDYLCEEDTILLESDLIVEDSVIDVLLDDPRANLALVDKYESWMDGTCLKISKEDYILDFISGSKFKFSETGDYYKTVNIYKFSKCFSQNQYVPFLEAYCKALGNNEYYEQVLKVIAMLDGSMIQSKKLSGQKWYEIDDAQDLDIANSLFPSDSSTRMSLISSRYGGYWRYPHMLDFCYLVNPYYPSKKMLSEIKTNADILICQYPSGLNVNRILVAKDFNVKIDNIVVGNGAAELINVLMNMISGKMGIIRPTFEEYPNRYKDELCVYTPESHDFSYSADDLISFYNDKNIDVLTIINPDNPSGNYIPSDYMKRIIEWTANKGIRLIVDESFVDFADEPDASLLDNDYLEDNPHLIVVKSISKSHGVPGIRLGILASGDADLISEIAKEVSIWNINSFAEFYLQIFEKYRKDFSKSLDHIKTERKRLLKLLSEIEGITAFDSQANFVMIELDSGISAAQLSERMLEDNILIKNLDGKIKRDNRQFLRIAIRTEEENNLMIELLKKNTK